MSESKLAQLRDGNASPMHVHLIGVAGSGMSGLASLLMGMGHKVSGSDRVKTLEIDRLVSEGLDFHQPQSATEHDGADLVIFSSAIREGNPAYDAAVEKQMALVRRAEALAAMMDRSKGVIVAGTHGKTTTSAMAAHVLRSGGLKPSHYVGAEIPLLGRNARWDEEGEYFVAEGDESDGTLALFSPEHAIVLNIEAEHLDFYKGGIDQINSVFQQLLDQTRGFFIYCGDDPGATNLCQSQDRGISYGWNRSCDYAAVNVEEKGGSTVFEVMKCGENFGQIELSIPGKHNVLNALSVIGLATELGVTFGVIKAALGTFRGAKRRFESKFRSDEFVLFDDYGHHPTEIEATLQTARSLHPERLVCVFQPHRFTRTQLLRDEFGRAFGAVDKLIVTDIYPASELPIPGITGDTIREAVREMSEKDVAFVPELQDARFLLGNDLKPGDLLMSMGAGNIHEVTRDIATDLETLAELKSVLDEEEAILKLYEPMKNHCTLRVGGPAQFWIEPMTVAGFARLVVHCKEREIPVRVVGRGSNLLIRDGGISGVVIHPVKGDFATVNAKNDLVEAGAGVRFKRVTSAAQSAGIPGFEWMEGIPGNVGGGIRMNAGAMGTETFDQVVSVTYINEEGQVRTRTKDEIVHHYRDVPEFTENYVVSVVFRGLGDDVEGIGGKIAKSKSKRKESQPIAASAGCMFKNPSVCGAGQLVDELGLKNSSVGKARVSEVHGNFIVNDGKATAKEVLELIARIQAKAKAERGVDLETEVQILGQDERY